MAILNSVPMRWPSGPLDVATRQKAGPLTAQVKQAIEYWHTPSALDILQGSPVNCLVVSWASGLAEDAEQQRTIRALVDAARQRKIDVIGWVEGKVDAKAAVSAAQAAGLSAVAIEGFKDKSDFPVIAWGTRDNAPWDSTGPVLPITDNVWPGVAAVRRDSASAGPTGSPWLDSNAWFLHLACARTKMPVWAVFDPPGKGEIVPARSYALAVCDAEKAGGRWVISLDDTLRAGLASKDASAVATMKTISDSVAFFARHPEWKTYHSLGFLGVISDFSPDNFFFASELLNLSSRRDLLSRPLWNTGKLTPDLTGIKAATWTDTAAPSPELRKRLLTFVQQGGLLVTGPKWGNEGTALTEARELFQLRSLGKGKIAVAKADLGDPWTTVVEIESMLSHANEAVKLFNASASGGFTYSGSPDGKRSLVQVLSYASGGRGGGSSDVTAWTRDKYRSAKLWTIDRAEPVSLTVVPCEDGGTEYHLPTMPAYIAMELEA